MPFATAIAANTLAAYRRAHYCVDALPSFVLRVDAPSAALQALQRRHGCACSVFITACNPGSQLLDPQVNALRQRALLEQLRTGAHTLFSGYGRDPDGLWPPEPSFLVLGLELDAAQQLGRRHEQNAVVWSGADAVPRLILLR